MPLKCETNLLQDMTEFTRFLALIRDQQVTSYLEIGSKHGGSFWRISSSLPKGSRVVSVDLPHGDTSFKESQPHLEACVEQLRKNGYDAHLFIGDSTNTTIIEKVRALSPFDLVFIDANHTEAFVRQDWANYGPMASVVAFHDISAIPKPASKKMPIEVTKVWKELKKDYEHMEIRCCPYPHENGIGILWRNHTLS